MCGAVSKIVVTGADSELGKRVVAELAGRPDNLEVVAVAPTTLAGLPPRVRIAWVDLQTGNLETLFDGVDAVIHLNSVSKPGQTQPRSHNGKTPDMHEPDAPDVADVQIVERVLRAAAICGVEQVVLMSSALVYGAANSNPLPLSEDAPIRPNTDFSWAVARAEIEKLADAHKSAHPSAKVAILRPTAVVTDDDLGQLARVLHTARLGVVADGDPPVQYLHITDLVSAVVVAALCAPDGPLNVAPDGWIPPDALRDLEGPKPRLRVPMWLARVLAVFRLRYRLAPIPPGVLPYATHSWVIANDRLRALGWCPSYSNEEAWVVSHKSGPLDWVPTRRRQELALATAAIGVCSVLTAIGWSLRRFLVVRRARK